MITPARRRRTVATVGLWANEVRKLITERKRPETDTGWRRDDMPAAASPRCSRGHGQFASGWQWRSARADRADRQYILNAIMQLARATGNNAHPVRRGRRIGQSAATSTMGRIPACARMLIASESGLELGLDQHRQSAETASRHESFHRRTFAWTENTILGSGSEVLPGARRAKDRCCRSRPEQLQEGVVRGSSARRFDVHAGALRLRGQLGLHGSFR